MAKINKYSNNNNKPQIIIISLLYVAFTDTHTHTQTRDTLNHTLSTTMLSYLPRDARGSALRILFFLHFAHFHLPLSVMLLLQITYYKINLHLLQTFPSLTRSRQPTVAFLLLPILPPPFQQPKQKLNLAHVFLRASIFIFQTHTLARLYLVLASLYSSVLKCIFFK